MCGGEGQWRTQLGRKEIEKKVGGTMGEALTSVAGGTPAFAGQALSIGGR